MSQPPTNATPPGNRRKAALLYGGLIGAAVAVAVGIAIFASRGDDEGAPAAADSGKTVAATQAVAVATAATFSLTATDFAFDKKDLELPAATKVTISMKNAGAAPHSLQLLDAKGGKELAGGATGAIVNAGQTGTISFTVPGAGTYFFQCGVHPGQMTGTLTVKAAGGAAAPTAIVAAPSPAATVASPAGQATKIEVTAVDLKFDAATLEATAGSAVTVTLKNAGQAPHSVQVLDTKGGKELAPGSTGKTAQAGQTDTFTFTAPAAGAYYFQCGIHPGAMNGTFTVKAAGGAAPSAPAGLASVTPPSVQSLLGSGLKAQVIAATNLTVDPSGTARVVQALKVGDRLIVVTNTPASSTFVITEGVIFWRVLVEGTQTVGWAPEVTTTGDRRFLDLVR